MSLRQRDSHIRNLNDTHRYTLGWQHAGSYLMNPPHVNNIAVALALAATMVMAYADDVINNDDVLHDDPELFFSVLNGIDYRLDFLLSFEINDTTGSVNLDWTGPIGGFSTIYYTSFTYKLLNGIYYITAKAGGKFTATGDGTIGLQWAQTPAAPVDTKRKAGSYLVWQPV